MQRPKYVRHLVREVIILDSAAFLTPRHEYVISDRYSPFADGEEPEAVLSLIMEGDRPYQVRLAVRGRRHVEEPSYYVKPPSTWREWGWIIIPSSQLRKVIRVLKSLVTPETPLHELM